MTTTTMTATDRQPTPAIEGRADANATRSQMTLPTSREFAEWVGRLAKFARIPRTSVLENGAVQYAQSLGFQEPAPPR